jgi:hypothetical protein
LVTFKYAPHPLPKTPLTIIDHRLNVQHHGIHVSMGSSSSLAMIGHTRSKSLVRSLIPLLKMSTVPSDRVSSTLLT